ncbi:hypothetical protein BDU57DRAFT_526796 [Ampelomyces quisqualis]|uniref:Uncharacterized protein n=1 Tax=Ampelomyces quisqualis TaxID=50730 RepID=A0A6A5R8D7_AMPQU|nr:hypothetical protein BDU57DRAFT_526796 [Ampelomyces quisqualis]
MEVRFSEWSPYAHARANWTQARMPFLLITTVGSKDDHFVYYTTNWIECMDRIMTCNLGVEARELEHVGDEFTLEFGHFEDLSKRDVPPLPPPTIPPIPAPFSDTPTGSGTPESSFDAALDQQAGFYEWTQETFAEDLGSFVDDITDLNYNHYYSVATDVGGIYNMDGSTSSDFVLHVKESDYELELRNLHRRVAHGKKRGKWSILRGKLVSIGQAAVNGTQNAIGDTQKKLGKAFKKVKKGIFGAIKHIKAWFDGSPRTLEAWTTFYYPKQDDGRWVYQESFRRQDGEYYAALPLFEAENGGATVNGYCLDCGAAANIRLRGTIGYKWGEGLKHGSVGLRGNFRTSLILGIASQYQYQYKDKKRIFTGGIPGLAVPPFFALGPTANADLGGEFDFILAGNMMAGMTADLKNLDAVVDFVNPDASKTSDFKIDIQPVAAVSDAVAARLRMSIQLSVALVLEVANMQARAAVSIISEPGVEVRLTGDAATSLTGGVNTATDDCDGLRLEYDLNHALYAQAEGKLVIGNFEFGKFNLVGDYRSKIKGRCIGKTNTVGYEINDGVVDLYEDFSVSFLELEPSTSNELFTTEFTDSLFVFPSVIRDFIEKPSSLESDIEGLSEHLNTAFNYSTVAEISLDWLLASTTEGNLALQSGESDLDPNNLFAFYKGVLVGDAFGRLLVYYDDEMARYSASRIRMVLPEWVPRSSKLIGLWPIDVDGTPDAGPGLPTRILAAIDTSTNPYFLVLCNYVDRLLASKVFIVSDPEVGIASLKSPNTVSTLTGSPIKKCDLLGLLTTDV